MINLIQTDNAVFDLVIDDLTSNNDDSAIQTLVYTVLFTDAEAPTSRVSDRYERRGWWADANAGTGLWHVRRQALTDSARREALAMVEKALLDHGVTNVVVSEQPVPGTVSSLSMLISGLHNGASFSMSVPL